VVALGLPPLVVLTVNGMPVLPAWAIILGFPVALVWRLAMAALPRTPTEQERIESIRAKARAKAERARMRRPPRA
jgi:choline-glycine betaine transporter